MLKISEAIYFIVKKKIKHDYVNIGGGEDFSILQLAKMIKKTLNYRGKIIFNRKYPDGVKVRKVDSSIMKKLGWQPK